MFLDEFDHIIKISIHALREEGDGMPLGVEPSQQISIHALREEGDDLRAAMLVRNLYFYPRPPRGGRPPQKHRQRQTI